MSLRFEVSINEDGSVEIKETEKIKRDKGFSLTNIPSDFTIIDLETSGLDPSFDEIIEVGALKIRDQKIVDTFQSLVKPNNFISDFIENLTGITNEMLSTAPRIKPTLKSFNEFIGDDILMGHNVNFDINFLYDDLYYYFDFKLTNDYVDLMRLTRKIYTNFENHKLNTIAKELNIFPSEEHRALHDCKTVYSILQKLNKHIDINNINLDALFKRQTTDLRTIKSNTDSFDEDHPLFNKHCTFTGKLEKLVRKEAAQLVVNLGGHCLNSVTKKTEYLVLGNFDYSASLIKGEKSSKLLKAEKMILDGHDITILSENAFYDMVFDL